MWGIRNNTSKQIYINSSRSDSEASILWIRCPFAAPKQKRIVEILVPKSCSYGYVLKPNYTILFLWWKGKCLSVRWDQIVYQRISFSTELVVAPRRAQSFHRLGHLYYFVQMLPVEYGYVAVKSVPKKHNIKWYVMLLQEPTETEVSYVGETFPPS
jgi:hypothetical protein